MSDQLPYSNPGIPHPGRGADLYVVRSCPVPPTSGNGISGAFGLKPGLPIPDPDNLTVGLSPALIGRYRQNHADESTLTIQIESPGTQYITSLVTAFSAAAAAANVVGGPSTASADLRVSSITRRQFSRFSLRRNLGSEGNDGTQLGIDPRFVRWPLFDSDLHIAIPEPITGVYVGVDAPVALLMPDRTWRLLWVILNTDDNSNSYIMVKQFDPRADTNWQDLASPPALGLQQFTGFGADTNSIVQSMAATVIGRQIYILLGLTGTAVDAKGGFFAMTRLRGGGLDVISPMLPIARDAVDGGAAIAPLPDGGALVALGVRSNAPEARRVVFLSSADLRTWPTAPGSGIVQFQTITKIEPAYTGGPRPANGLIGLGTTGGLLGPNTSAVTSVSFAAQEGLYALRAWACTRDGAVWVTTNGGTAWSNQTSSLPVDRTPIAPGDSPRVRKFNKVVAIPNATLDDSGGIVGADPGTCTVYLFGDDLILKSTDSGATWKVLAYTSSNLGADGAYTPDQLAYPAGVGAGEPNPGYVPAVGQAIPTFSYVDADFTDKDTGHVLCGDGTLLYFEGGGLKWTVAVDATSSATQAQCLARLSATAVLIGGAGLGTGADAKARAAVVTNATAKDATVTPKLQEQGGDASPLVSMARLSSPDSVYALCRDGKVQRFDGVDETGDFAASAVADVSGGIGGAWLAIGIHLIGGTSTVYVTGSTPTNRHRIATSLVADDLSLNFAFQTSTILGTAFGFNAGPTGVLGGANYLATITEVRSDRAYPTLQATHDGGMVYADVDLTVGTVEMFRADGPLNDAPVFRQVGIGPRFPIPDTFGDLPASVPKPTLTYEALGVLVLTAGASILVSHDDGRSWTTDQQRCQVPIGEQLLDDDFTVASRDQHRTLCGLDDGRILSVMFDAELVNVGTFISRQWSADGTDFPPLNAPKGWFLLDDLRLVMGGAPEPGDIWTIPADHLYPARYLVSDTRAEGWRGPTKPAGVMTPEVVLYWDRDADDVRAILGPDGDREAGKWPLWDVNAFAAFDTNCEQLELAISAFGDPATTPEDVTEWITYVSSTKPVDSDGPSGFLADILTSIAGIVGATSVKAKKEAYLERSGRTGYASAITTKSAAVLRDGNRALDPTKWWVPNCFAGLRTWYVLTNDQEGTPRVYKILSNTTSELIVDTGQSAQVAPSVDTRYWIFPDRHFWDGIGGQGGADPVESANLRTGQYRFGRFLRLRFPEQPTAEGYFKASVFLPGTYVQNDRPYAPGPVWQATPNTREETALTGESAVEHFQQGQKWTLNLQAVPQMYRDALFSTFLRDQRMRQPFAFVPDVNDPAGVWLVRLVDGPTSSGIYEAAGDYVNVQLSLVEVVR